MRRVFVRFAEVLLKFFVKGFLAPERAEVVGLSFILGCASGGCGVNIHSAGEIFNSHRFQPFLDRDLNFMKYFLPGIGQKKSAEQ